MENTDNKGVYLPPWAIGIIVTVVIGLFGWETLRSSTSSADHVQLITNTEIINNEIKPQLEIVKATKADKTDLERIYTELGDIKDLILKHMDKAPAK
jgi:hypothetical protein